jgi:hypothetical protein
MGSIANAPIEARLDRPTIEERRALIDRVAASSQFRRSTRLRDFLLYVGGQSLKEGCPEIHEQEVGARVFGRSASYDRSQDNIVRVNATELRKRIDAYFASDGAHETLILEIPRGGYKPLFHRRLPEIPSDPALSAETPADLPRAEAIIKSGNTHPHLLWATVSALLAAACLILLYQNLAMRKQVDSWDRKPAVAALWADFLKGHQRTDIVLPDASVSISEEIVGHPMTLPDYLNHRYSVPVETGDVSPDRRADLTAIFNHNLVAFGDFRAAQQILALNPIGSSLHLTLSRFYGADSLKSNSAILIGGKKANPWVRLFDDKMNFSLDYDDDRAQGFIANRHPQPGEPSRYSTVMDPNGLVGYTAIAYLPNPSHSGNVIIFAGTDSDATNAGAEFLTSEAQLSKFRHQLRLSKFPYFEVLLKTSRLSGTAFNAEMLAYRIYREEN